MARVKITHRLSNLRTRLPRRKLPSSAPTSPVTPSHLVHSVDSDLLNIVTNSGNIPIIYDPRSPTFSPTLPPLLPPVDVPNILILPEGGSAPLTLDEWEASMTFQPGVVSSTSSSSSSSTPQRPKVKDTGFKGRLAGPRIRPTPRPWTPVEAPQSTSTLIGTTVVPPSYPMGSLEVRRRPSTGNCITCMSVPAVEEGSFMFCALCAQWC